MELIQILTAIVICYLSGKHPIKDLANVMSPANRAKVLGKIPELKGAFEAYDKGKEFDWGALSAGVKRYAEAYAKSPGARATSVLWMKNYATFFRTSSPNALKVIEKLTADMDDDFIRGYFEKPVVSQKAVTTTLKSVVKKLGGEGIELTLEERKAAKEANPLVYSEYLQLRKGFVDSWKGPMNNYIRNQDETTVPLQEVLDHLKSHGIVTDLPTGFIGRIDANGAVYTMKNEKILGGLPSKAMFPVIKMNPEYDGTNWVFMSQRQDGSAGNYAYTEGLRKSQNKDKFAKVATFDAEATRKKWVPLIKALDPYNAKPDNVAALILEILYRTSNRVGSKVITDPKAGGFGIASLLVGHFYLQSDGSIRFIYLGKDSVKTVANIKRSDDALAAIVCEKVASLAAGKKPRDPLFTYDLANSTKKIVQASVVTRLFKSLTGNPDLTVHKLRTAKGTKLFKDYIAKVYAKYPTLTPVQVNEMVKKAGGVIGKVLNHVRRSAEGPDVVQPMTSLKNYVDPNAQVEFFQHYGAPIPKYLEAIMAEDEGGGFEQSSRVTAGVRNASDAMERMLLELTQEGRGPFKRLKDQVASVSAYLDTGTFSRQTWVVVAKDNEGNQISDVEYYPDMKSLKMDFGLVRVSGEVLGVRSSVTSAKRKPKKEKVEAEETEEDTEAEPEEPAEPEKEDEPEEKTPEPEEELPTEEEVEDVEPLPAGETLLHILKEGFQQTMQWATTATPGIGWTARLKITKADYEVLEAAINRVIQLNPNIRERYKNAGLSDMRFRWDLLHASKLKIGDGVGMSGDLELYRYLNDSHIDAALAAITGTKKVSASNRVRSEVIVPAAYAGTASSFLTKILKRMDKVAAAHQGSLGGRDSVPGAPDSSKFRSVREGMIQVEYNVVTHGAYGTPTRHDIFLKVGSTVDFTVRRAITDDIVAYAQKILGAAQPLRLRDKEFGTIHCADKIIYLSITYGSAWGGIGFRAYPYSEYDWNHRSQVSA